MHFNADLVHPSETEGSATWANSHRNARKNRIVCGLVCAPRSVPAAEVAVSMPTPFVAQPPKTSFYAFTQKNFRAACKRLRLYAFYISLKALRFLLSRGDLALHHIADGHDTSQLIAIHDQDMAHPLVGHDSHQVVD